jgi:hypothetical protein
VAWGASRWRLGRQLFADALVITAGGAAAGVIVAMWMADVVPVLFYAEDAATLVYRPNLTAVVVVALTCSAIMTLAAMLPLLDVRDDRPADVLRREGRGPSNAMRRLRATLVAGQMTLCCLLVIATGLLTEGFRASLRTNAGALTGQPIVATVQAGRMFDAPTVGLAYFAALEAALQQLPEVTRTAWVGALPGSRPAWQIVRVEPADLAERAAIMATTYLTPASLRTLQLPPLAGRLFGGADTPRSCPAIVVDDVAAAQWFDGDAIGRRIVDPDGRLVDVIGVVAQRPRPGISAPIATAFYYPEQMAVPVTPAAIATFRVPVRPGPLADALVDGVVVSPTYFDAMGFGVVAGRLPLTTAACREAVVNEEAAERFFGGRAAGASVIDALGRRTAIVGVIRSPLLRASQRRVEPAIYLPLTANFQPRMTLIVTGRDAGGLSVERVARQLEAVAGGEIVAVASLETHLARTALAPDRIATRLVGVSAGLALVIGLLGIAGAMSDAARQRRREIALRIAVGASARRIVTQVLREGARLAAAGAASGMIASLGVAEWMRRIAPDASAPAPWIWIAAPALLGALVLVGGLLPARRALAVDPILIMRE